MDQPQDGSVSVILNIIQMNRRHLKNPLRFGSYPLGKILVGQGVILKSEMPPRAVTFEKLKEVKTLSVHFAWIYSRKFRECKLVI